MRPFLLLMLATALLAACGKKGPPSPPGPADKIIYPKAYPKPAPFPTDTAAPE